MKYSRIVCHFTLGALFVLITAGCLIVEEEGGSNAEVVTGNFVYNVHEVDEEFILPNKLEEISGLAYLTDHTFLCVQDEKGVLYFYNTDEKEIVHKIKFGKSGDYEGVTVIDSTAYVIRSNGKLYEIEISEDSIPEINNYELPFKSSNDLEGLSAGHLPNTLYIACKDNPKILDNGIKGRAIYEYNISTKKVDPKPYINFTKDMFFEKLYQHDLKPSKHTPIMPSGLAIHPITQDVFLISSVGKLLIVLDKKGNIKDMATLKRKLLIQPEGICFDTEGNLYISSEGRGGKGYILMYEPKNTDQE